LQLFRNALKSWIYFRQLSSFIVNYRQLLSWWESTNLVYLQKCSWRLNIFSSIIIIYCKLSSIIVRMRVNEYRNSSEMLSKDEYIFVNYVPDARFNDSRIPSEMLLKVEYIFVNYRQLLSGSESQRISYIFRNALEGWIYFRQ
jgi:hypothetical protein